MPPARHEGLGLPPLIVETVSGLSAGLLSTLCVHPLDLIKTRLQVDRAPPHFGATLHLLRRVSAESQYGLYRGLSPNLVGNMLSWGLYFMLYNEFKTLASSTPSSSSSSSSTHDYPQPLSSATYLATSASAGLVTAVLTNPLWVVKTRMLTTDAAAPGAYEGLVQGLGRILRDEGPRGLARGLVPACVGVSHGALQFMFYEKGKNVLSARRLERERGSGGGGGGSGRREGGGYGGLGDSEKLGNAEVLACSAGSKVLAGVVSYPYRVVQTRMQNFVDVQARYGGVGDVVRKVWRGEGVRGFYKGLAPNILRVLPSTCITFLVYENAKHYLR